MMKEYCNFNLQHFIMVGIDQNGKLVKCSGPTAPGALEEYIDMDGYHNWFTTGSMNASKYPLAPLDSL